jgi:enoyl-CoA hydratase
MAARVVEYERKNAVAVLALNRPERLNAINHQTVRELGVALDRAEQDKHVRVIVVHGRGRIFCAGGDIHTAGEVDGVVEALDYLVEIRPLFDRMSASRLPTIAAVHGAALGGGLELALACDLRVATRDTAIGLPEVTIGALPAGGGLTRLTRIVGPAWAKEIVFTGNPLSAERGLEIGLVNRVTDGDHLEAALEWANEIAGRPPMAIGLAKRVIDRATTTDAQSASELELLATTILFGTDDRREGMAAFVEKRAPEFTGQ